MDRFLLHSAKRPSSPTLSCAGLGLADGHRCGGCAGIKCFQPEEQGLLCSLAACLA